MGNLEREGLQGIDGFDTVQVTFPESAYCHLSYDEISVLMDGMIGVEVDDLAVGLVASWFGRKVDQALLLVDDDIAHAEGIAEIPPEGDITEREIWALAAELDMPEEEVDLAA